MSVGLTFLISLEFISNVTPTSQDIKLRQKKKKMVSSLGQHRHCSPTSGGKMSSRAGMKVYGPLFRSRDGLVICRL